MFDRQRKTKDPCPDCGLHRQRCMCALIPRLETRTRVSLVIHAKELKRTSNTGRLATAALSNSCLRVRGEGREALDLSDLLDPGYRNWVFYPSADAVELDRALVDADPRPVHLIVPDGNWRQASKVNTRHPEFEGLTRVKITARNPYEHHLRAESTEYGMATLNAIACALKNHRIKRDRRSIERRVRRKTRAHDERARNDY